ncbi:tetratricopeptide repeat protein [Bradyrhizobium sp. PMVTL-01]|uniref:tetratricopeptide repeat protein n=1 Tax=Bradyrhizobium sp. PMVTL-01 TaxID=3434999 RepID=UPI003F72CB9D
MGQVDRDLNRDAEAEAPIKRSLAIRERALGPNHPDTLSSTGNLAYFLHVSGRTADALPLPERTLAGDRAQLRTVLPILFSARQQHLARPTASLPATSRDWASHRLRSPFPISPPTSTTVC